jgi:hypothetical protein
LPQDILIEIEILLANKIVVGTKYKYKHSFTYVLLVHGLMSYPFFILEKTEERLCARLTYSEIMKEETLSTPCDENSALMDNVLPVIETEPGKVSKAVHLADLDDLATHFLIDTHLGFPTHKMCIG